MKDMKEENETIRVKVIYNLKNDELEEFTKQIGKYTKRINVKDTLIYNTTLGGSYNYTKKSLLHNKIQFDRICKTISDNGTRTTRQLYLVCRKFYSYRHFNRLLAKYAICGMLKVKKIKRKEGGYERIWSLK